MFDALRLINLFLTAFIAALLVTIQSWSAVKKICSHTLQAETSVIQLKALNPRETNLESPLVDLDHFGS